jgi:hypothetical protein
MSEWLSLEKFGYSDIKATDGTALPAIVSGTNTPGSISEPIRSAPDYYLKNRMGEVMTDSSLSPVSFEGLNYA